MARIKPKLPPQQPSSALRAMMLLLAFAATFPLTRFRHPLCNLVEQPRLIAARGCRHVQLAVVALRMICYLVIQLVSGSNNVAVIRSLLRHKRTLGSGPLLTSWVGLLASVVGSLGLLITSLVVSIFGYVSSVGITVSLVSVCGWGRSWGRLYLTSRRGAGGQSSRAILIPWQVVPLDCGGHLSKCSSKSTVWWSAADKLSSCFLIGAYVGNFVVRVSEGIIVFERH